VRPFGLSSLYPAAEKTLLRLVADGTPYGITPGEGWDGGDDPWSAPTAWSAWALAGLAAERARHHEGGSGGGRRTPAALADAPDRPGAAAGSAAELATADRRAALGLLGDLRRASTRSGDLPERVSVHTGIPTSTTPLLWSSAFTVLALRELWP
jgi:hypothetical protein